MPIEGKMTKVPYQSVIITRDRAYIGFHAYSDSSTNPFTGNFLQLKSFVEVFINQYSPIY